MAKKPTLQTISTDVPGLDSALNVNLTLLNDTFSNTLSLDGSTPNAMGADLDLNSFDILNGGVANFTTIAVNGVNFSEQVAAAAASATAADASATSAASSAASATSSASSAATSASTALGVLDELPDWQGAWLTATAYELGDLTQESGNTYICIVAHTSGTFATDLGAGKWELFASKGDSGAGTGDLVSTNNLSDITNPSVARTNLGLIIGTDVQAQDTLLQSVAGLTFGADNYIYGTGSDTAAVGTITAFGRSLVDDAAASNARTTLGLGTIATTDLIDEDDMISDSALRAPSQQSVKAYVDAIVVPSLSRDTTVTLSGTSVSFTGIPAGTKRIMVALDAVSFNSTDHLLLRLGTSGGIVSTGYFSGAHRPDSASVTNTTGIVQYFGSAASAFIGIITLVDMGGNLWVSSHSLSSIEGSASSLGGGRLPLGGTLTQLLLLGTGGNTFDNGRINIFYE